MDEALRRRIQNATRILEREFGQQLEGDTVSGKNAYTKSCSAIALGESPILAVIRSATAKSA